MRKRERERVKGKATPQQWKEAQSKLIFNFSEWGYDAERAFQISGEKSWLQRNSTYLLGALSSRKVTIPCCFLRRKCRANILQSKYFVLSSFNEKIKIVLPTHILRLRWYLILGSASQSRRQPQGCLFTILRAEKLPAFIRQKILRSPSFFSSCQGKVNRRNGAIKEGWKRVMNTAHLPSRKKEKKSETTPTGIRDPFQADPD